MAEAIQLVRHRAIDFPRARLVPALAAALVTLVTLSLILALWPRPLPVETATAERGRAGSVAILEIPESSLFRDGEGWAVFALGEDGRAHRRAVEIGHRDSGRVEILAGLAPGETVIVGPLDDIGPGDRVRPARGPE